MKQLRRTPKIPTYSVALAAFLLGFLLARSHLPPSQDTPSLVDQIVFAAIHPVGLISIAFVLVFLLIFKWRSDQQSQMESDLLETFLEYIPDNVFFKDRKSRFLRISRSLADYFGIADPAQAQNKTDVDIFSAEHARQALSDEQEILRTGRSLIGVEEKETWPDGHESWVLTTKVPLRDRYDRIIGTMGISHNITERKQAEARIRYMALHDALTGLPNRTLLQDRLASAIALAHRNRNRVAVLMLDLDRFKHVNDSFGHDVGDHLLETVAKRLQSCLRESDIVARFGGDEFVVALPNVVEDSDAETVARKIASVLSQESVVDGHLLRISTSIGISQYPINGETPETLLQAADIAMYQVKSKGRGTFFFFRPELSEATQREWQLEKDLPEALARNEFMLYYQPFVATKSGSITGVEALLRWQHPVQGLIYPSQFISHLEELGLMTDVGNWVLRVACLQIVAWQRDGMPPVRVAVNVSAQQFYQSSIVRNVEKIILETGMDPGLLELELTESLALDDSETTVKIMHDLKHLGISLSLDDFGTGWSSLSYLRRFPIDRLKIDRSFTRDLTAQPAAEAVVKSMLSLGHNLGIACIAEGIETQQQLNYFQHNLCAEVQGFVFSRALPAADCAVLIREGETCFRELVNAEEKNM